MNRTCRCLRLAATDGDPRQLQLDGAGGACSKAPARRIALRVRLGMVKRDGPVIEIKLNTPEQLLNSFDPSPFHSRDLDDRAADYIIDSAEEADSGGPLALVIELPGDQAMRELSMDLPLALRNSFRFRARQARLQLRDQFRLGRLSLAIGLAVLGLCTLVIHLLELSVAQSTFAQMMEQGLFILGWVALWRPLEIFLYDWWPLARRIRLLERLSDAKVEIRSR